MKNLVLIALILTGFFAGTINTSAQNNTKSNEKVKELIKKKRAYNKKYGFGYKIQIYYGNETRARSLRSKFRYEFPKTKNSLDYKQPYWKVLVGNYKTKLEADKDLIRFSEKFSGIIIVPMGK